jgi:hypothetical protein
VIFGRRGGSGRHARADQARRSGPRHAAVERRADEFDGYPPGYGDPVGPADEPAAAGGGPYDVSEAPRGVQRLDLGSLQIPAIEGVEVRVQANPDGEIQQVVLVNGTNALQLGVFAAPRSEGIWHDVRTEIRKSLFNDGVAAEEREGEFGTELRARVRTPEGLTDIRFVGVDGPRWMVRGVYQGPAAVDPAKAGPLAICLKELVVDRGQEARPVREPLPLRLPKDVADQTLAQQAAAPGAGPPSAPAQQPVNGTAAASAAPPSAAPPPAAPPSPPQPAAAPRRKPSPRPRRPA